MHSKYTTIQVSLNRLWHFLRECNGKRRYCRNLFNGVNYTQKNVLNLGLEKVWLCSCTLISLHESACYLAYSSPATLLSTGQSPKDLKGLHNNRRRVISDVVPKIKEYIQSFSLKTSHYSVKPTKHYLDVTLNVYKCYAQTLCEKISRHVTFGKIWMKQNLQALKYIKVLCENN